MTRRSLSFRGRAITIACTDQKRSERFYERVLGAGRVPGDGYGCSWFRLGPLTLNLMPNAAGPSPAEFPTHAMPILWLEVDDLDAARRHLARHGVPIIEDHEGQFLMATDPDGLVFEVWQCDTERFELVQIPELVGACGPVRVTLSEAPFLRSARTGAIRPIEAPQATAGDEPFEGDFVQFLRDQIMFRCGSYKMKGPPPDVSYLCKVCQIRLSDEPGAVHRFDINPKLLDTPPFYLGIEAPSADCPRCGRRLIPWSDEVDGQIQQALAETLSRAPEWHGEGPG